MPDHDTSNSDLKDLTGYRYFVDETVRFADLDALGHANNNAFGVFFESSRVGLFDEMGFRDGEGNVVLARITIDFLKELHMGDRLRVGSKMLKVGNTSITLGSGIFRNSICCATSQAVLVWFDFTDRRPKPVPDHVRERLQHYR